MRSVTRTLNVSLRLFRHRGRVSQPHPDRYKVSLQKLTICRTPYWIDGAILSSFDVKDVGSDVLEGRLQEPLSRSSTNYATLFIEATITKYEPNEFRKYLLEKYLRRLVEYFLPGTYLDGIYAFDFLWFSLPVSPSLSPRHVRLGTVHITMPLLVCACRGCGSSSCGHSWRGRRIWGGHPCDLPNGRNGCREQIPEVCGTILGENPRNMARGCVRKGMSVGGLLVRMCEEEKW